MAKKIFYATALLLLVLFSFSAQARIVTDMAGREVKAPEKISKVFATAPPATCMVYAIAPDMLVGLNMPLPKAGRRFLDARVMGLPVMGGWFGQGRMANLETLMQARPDVVVSFRLRGLSMGWKIEETLEPLGLPVAGVVFSGIGDYPAIFRFLGKLFGRVERGEALAAYAEKTLADMEQLRRSLPPHKRVKVYYAEGGRGLQTECDTSFHAELIPICGGVNVHRCQLKAICGLEKVSVEQVLAYNPQVILTHNEMFHNSVFTDPRWKSIRAVSTGRVYKIPVLPLNWFDRPPSFMSLLGAHWVAHKLYPQDYKIDLHAKAKEFFKLFLGVNLNKADLNRLLGR